VTGERLAYRVREASQQLGLSERQTWRLIQVGDLRVVRAGRATLVPLSSLEDFIARGLNDETAGATNLPAVSEGNGNGLNRPARSSKS
jgi:excisionase family DNA binding protein